MEIEGPLQATINPMERAPIQRKLDVGVGHKRSVDFRCGQRIGLVAGSGLAKVSCSGC